MLKPLLLLAFTAQAILLASSTDKVQRSFSKNTTSSSSSSSKSQSSVTSTSYISPVGPCIHGHEYQHVSSSSSRSSSSSSSSTSLSTEYIAHSDHHPDCRSCPPNEIWAQCPDGVCAPKTCEDVGLPIPCLDLKPGAKCPSKSGCICREGFVRNYKGICIPATHCPRCTKKNQVFDPCIAPCPPRRCDVDERLIKCAPPPKVGDPLCEAGCRCADGYATNYEGVCIPKNECPPRCPDNEWYSECTQGNCSPQNCSQVGFPEPCPKIDRKYCKKGCLCNEGFARNDEGFCIPLEKCPSCGGDSKKKAGCGVYCNQRCRDIGKKPGACIDICYENACDCLEGYFLDENTGFCVLPEDCTPQCLENEWYSECTQSNCSPQNCSQVGFPVPCSRIDPKYCKKGCLCNEGYARDDKGKCIPTEECPSCGGDSKKKVGCGVYCNQRCRDIGKEPGACIAICYENACDCLEGYFLDENTGFCVLPEDCTPQCLENEWYSECTQSNCSPQNCSQVGFPVPCSRIDPKYCKKGCLCNEGYARNDKGKCIPTEECPSCGGDCKKKPGCGVYCNQRCRDIGKKPGACIEICYENACDCQEGYFLDENTGFCVLPEDCTPQCLKNEWYSECTQSNCSPQNCSQVGFPVPCPRIDHKYCKKGCLCNEGYARNDKGICIPTEECLSCGGDSKKKPGCGVYCNQRCRDIGKKPGACIDICYENACDCQEGYFLDENTGFCVLPEDCTPQCPKNEWYSECTQGNCSPENCSQVGFPVPCPRIDPKYCKKGCLCNEGYARNDKGICIPTEECPPTCLAANNEVYSDCINGGCQAKNCSQYNTPVQCIKIDPKRCIKGCLCKKGYLRAKNGKCIPEKDCPEACNGPNEEYNECSFNCPPQTCESLDRAYACLIKDGEDCKPMCRCKPGYFRNKIGQCITEKQCRRCMQKHEYYSCGSPCDNVCKTLHEQNQTNCPIVNKKCTEMCYCENGYARAQNNSCIPINSCKEPQCPLNERYEKCPGASCEPQYCSQLGFPIPCPAQAADGRCSGKPACVCVDGFVRSENGSCILKKECPSCGGDFRARSGCGVNCGKNCRDIGKDGVACILICYVNACDCIDGYYYDSKQKKCVLPEQCTDICGENEVFEDCSNPVCRAKNCTELGFPLDCKSQCTKGCVCIGGYVRDDKGRCIPVNKCRPICLEQNNEVYSDCINAGCTRKNCSQYGKPVPCNKIDLKYCIKGCLCKEGYLRAANGKCIPQKDCPEACDGPNEEYNGCSFNCPPQTCESLDRAYDCPIRDENDCTPMCRCKPGYFRNKIGQCITEKQCRMCMEKEHEFYSCGGACDNVCETLHEQNQTNCPIVNIKCNEMCYCEDGYARAKNGTCIPISCCNEPQCPLNEIYKKCPEASCEPRHCSQLGYPIPCPVPAEDGRCPGKPGCVCVDGLVRDKNGKCIPKEECPSCGGDSYAKPGCGVNCLKTCYDLQNPDRPRPCPRICRVNACDCKEGYYLDENINKCVCPKDCSPICGKHEIYSSCVNSGCEKKNCSQLGQPMLCTDPIKCIGGCICEKGFLRLKNGTCVPYDQCPSPICLEQNNEVYSDCINGGCTRKNCSQYGKPVPCIKIDPKYCIKGCLCKEGYLRAANGKCIPQKDCPEACNGLNEEYNECSDNCPPQTCESLDRAYVCPIRDENYCTPMCRCKPGYYRNKIGQCITEKQCRMCMEKEHEFYSCGGACDNVCETLHEQNQTNCPIVNIKCNEMCYCEDGYARAKNGTCIPISCCNEPQCPLNEIYKKCPEASCEPRHCSQLGYPIPCPVPAEDGRCPGKPGCVCVDGLVRDKNGKCIPKEECPSCGGDSYAKPGCGVNCLKTCYDLQNPDRHRPCPRICRVNACDCKEGYYLDKNINKCVRPKDCSPICGKHEIYSSCVNGACEKKNCSQLGQPMLCTDPIKCVGGCICEEGFLRLKNGTCVPYDQCPKPKCKKNERFVLCPAKVCQPQSCKEVGFHIDCLDKKDNCTGYPACICVNGYVRNRNGICRPKSECSSCGGDPNARPGCGINCGKRCPNHKLNPRLCPRICLPNACACKDGFYYDINVKKCVKLNQCSPRCDQLNKEVYDPCVNGGCGWRNCSQVGGPIICKRPMKCKKGCRCIEGHYRLNNGTCVPENKCPPNCWGINEIFDPCPPKCSPQTCESLNRKYFCPRQNATDCTGQCRCKFNFYRNAIGECIHKDDCRRETTATTTTTIKPTTKPTPTTNATKAIANFERGNQDLVGEFLYQLLCNRPGENFMISGFSILLAMAQLGYNAKKDAERQILHLLKLKDRDEIEAVFRMLIKNYKNQKEVEFKIKVKCCSNKNYPFADSFVQDSAIFDSEVQSLDFSEREKSADIINAWAEENTNGLIKDLVNADMFNEDTRFVLLNALYFSGKWEKEFNKNYTEPREFYTDNDNSVLMDTMYQEGKFEYAENDDLDCQMVRLKNKGGNFSFVVFLPWERTGLSKLIDNLRKPGNFANSLTLLSLKTVEMYLPRLNFESDISEFPDLLKKVNVTEAFKPGSNNFEGILKNDEPLFISHIKQKTKITVDESGAELAAATESALHST